MPDPTQLAALRREYAAGGLAENDLAATWHEQLGRWLDDADAAGVNELNAVVLATAAAAGQPSARTVLLKAYDERGLVVFTSYASRKGLEVGENPTASLVLPYVDLERQVVVVGSVERTSVEESEAYFRTRPRGAQISVWASRQSSVVGAREELEMRHRELEQRFDGQDVPLPDWWGGLRLVPETVEFWQGRSNRLHDRLRFRRAGSDWVVERLSP
ncbi:MAG: pyridoxamine 5'-phosphate oxidase [Mycobacteriales bacterium]